jgi:ABC-type nitrate/sulfonate/bicarbonate transport system substrate-binding protein
VKKDENGKTYYSWDKETDGGYYNLDAMLKLKGLSGKDIDLINLTKESEAGNA